MTDTKHKTKVQQLYSEGICNHRILHGQFDEERTIIIQEGLTKKESYFAPNKIVFYERWERNNFGTTSWEIFAFKTAEPLREIQSIPGVSPGAILCLHVSGKMKVKAVFQFLDELKAKNIDPCSLSEPHIRFLNSRVLAGLSLDYLLGMIISRRAIENSRKSPKPI